MRDASRASTYAKTWLTRHVTRILLSPLTSEVILYVLVAAESSMARLFLDAVRLISSLYRLDGAMSKTFHLEVVAWVTNRRSGANAQTRLELKVNSKRVYRKVRIQDLSQSPKSFR